MAALPGKKSKQDIAPPEGATLAPEDTGVIAPPVGATLVEDTAIAPPIGATLAEEPQPPGIPDIQIPQPEEEPGIGGKIMGRLFGADVRETDVDIPRALTTAGTAGAAAIAGGQAGITAGALTGPFAPVAVPVFGSIGALTGGVLGAFGGSALPEASIEAAEFLGILEEGSRERVGLSPVELQTVMEGEALLEAATFGVLGIGRAGARVTSQLFTGANKEAAEAAAKLGVDMSPVVVGDGVVGRGFATVFGRFPFLGGGAIRREATKTSKQAEELIRGLPARIAPLLRSKLGKRILKDGKTLLKKSTKAFNKRYAALWARADDAGVKVAPEFLLERADEILKRITEKDRLDFVTGSEPTPASVAIVEKFIKERVLPMRGPTPAEFAEGSIELNRVPVVGQFQTSVPGVQIKEQSLKAMDALVETIDQDIAKLAPGEKRFVNALFKQLRIAAQKDVLTNMRGANALEIVTDLKAIDADYSHTMSQIFQTAAANKIGSVKKRGLRGLGFERATRIPVDKLANVMVDLDSPQIMDEISRLVSPQTYKNLAAHVIDGALRKSLKTTGNVGQFNIDEFAKRLGLDGSNAARREAVEVMLVKADSPVTMKMLDDIVEVGKAVGDFDIPNVSSFIARRGAIGGAKSIIDGMIPGLAILGGGSAAAFGVGQLFGVAMFVGGTRLFGSIISDPKNARALSKVFDKEVNQAVRRTAIFKMIVTGLESITEDDEPVVTGLEAEVGDESLPIEERLITKEELEQLKSVAERTMKGLDSHYGELKRQINLKVGGS